MWKIVCGEQWSNISAILVCNKLGFYSNLCKFYVLFSCSTGNIELCILLAHRTVLNQSDILQDSSTVTCNETISNCSPMTNCYRPASIFCDGCLEGSLKLVPQVDDFGTNVYQFVQVCDRGSWTYICVFSYHSKTAVICRQLGLPYLGRH